MGIFLIFLESVFESKLSQYTPNYILLKPIRLRFSNAGRDSVENQWCWHKIKKLDLWPGPWILTLPCNLDLELWVTWNSEPWPWMLSQTPVLWIRTRNSNPRLGFKTWISTWDLNARPSAKIQTGIRTLSSWKNNWCSLL